MLIHVVTHHTWPEGLGVSSAHRSYQSAEKARHRYISEAWPTYARGDPDLPNQPPADPFTAAKLLAEAGCYYKIAAVELDD